MMNNLMTPVALFVYRRPEHTRRVVERIKEAEPPQILVVGDGPIGDHERERVEAVRRIIAEADWECEVSTNYVDSNLGLKERFVTGLDWIFNKVPEAIILEDDTVPEAAFFDFCDELLNRFRGDKRVWDITGRNELESYSDGDYSYFYSHYGSIWGWATWRSSYEEYDPNMTAWEDHVVQSRIQDMIADRWQSYYLCDKFERTYSGEIKTWDYQWGFARLRNNAVSVVPDTNMVKNIGFGDLATNTTGSDAPHSFGGKSTGQVDFPLNHPNFIGANKTYDSKFHQQREHRRRAYPIYAKLIIMMYQKVKNIVDSAGKLYENKGL